MTGLIWCWHIHTHVNIVVTVGGQEGAERVRGRCQSSYLPGPRFERVWVRTAQQQQHQRQHICTGGLPRKLRVSNCAPGWHFLLMYIGNRHREHKKNQHKEQQTCTALLWGKLSLQVPRHIFSVCACVGGWTTVITSTKCEDIPRVALWLGWTFDVRCSSVGCCMRLVGRYATTRCDPLRPVAVRYGSWRFGSHGSVLTVRFTRFGFHGSRIECHISNIIKFEIKYYVFSP